MLVRCLNLVLLTFTKAKNFRSFCTLSSLAISTNNHPTHLPTWISNNELFQRHPRLHCLEQRCNSFRRLKQILPYVFVSGLHKNPFVMSRILYLTLFELDEGVNLKSSFGAQVFDQIGKPNVFSWNTIIRFFAVYNDDTQCNTSIAFEYYRKMLKQGNFPDNYTFPFLLQACGSISSGVLLTQVQSHIVKLGFWQNLYVQNSLLHVLLSLGFLLDARKVFDEMSEKDVISWTTLISGLSELGSHGEALIVFRDMKGYGLVTRPNGATMLSVLSACGYMGSLDQAKCLHALLEKDGWAGFVSIGNSLIDAYAKCGNLLFALQVFNDMSNHDLYTWTAVISGLAIHGQGIDACEMFYKMVQASRIVPDEITLIAILSACAHSGLVEEGLHIFESMTTEYGIQPGVKHYGCLIDLLGRAGMLERACHIMEAMPMEPNLTVLGSLLSACRMHKNMDLAELVLRKIKPLSGSSGGAPVLLSNMYADEEKWSEVIHIRKGIREEVQEKSPGKSWIQVKDTVNEFVVGDKYHPQALELLMVLEGLERLARMTSISYYVCIITR